MNEKGKHLREIIAESKILQGESNKFTKASPQSEQMTGEITPVTTSKKATWSLICALLMPVTLITDWVLYINITPAIYAKVTEYNRTGISPVFPETHSIGILLAIVLGLIPFVLEISGLVLGFDALNTIKTSKARLSGKPLAITGIVSCYV